jgi:hypothetical protein
MTLTKIIQRFLLYVGIALAVLVVLAAVIIFTKGGIGHVSGGWFGLVGYTGLLFWATIRQTRAHWQRVGYWFTLGGLLVVHSLAFVGILRAYPEWPMIWFMPVVIVEGGLFGAILFVLFAKGRSADT